MLKEWFYFSRSDRRAILLLSVLLIIMVSLLWWKSEHVAHSEISTPTEDSLALASFEQTIRDKGRLYMSRRDSMEKRDVASRGQSTWKTSNQFKLRTKNYAWVDKFQRDTVLDLNMADTTLLKRVPGIGSWRARRIVQFREHLGGYNQTEQLLEIDGMPDSVLRWFVIHTPVFEKIDLNRATADEMAAHPYLTYKQARVILQHKRLHGPLRSLDQLSLYEEFPPKELKKIEPYVAF